ncbi:MAG: hypothetical protein LIO91_03395 [Bacteroidales bacterium]|nr:hypothetical protein [Bacteroidales bacterium]
MKTTTSTRKGVRLALLDLTRKAAAKLDRYLNWCLAADRVKNPARL